MAKRSDRIQWSHNGKFTDGSDMAEVDYDGFEFVTEAGIPISVSPALLPWNAELTWSLGVDYVAPAFGPHQFTVRMKGTDGQLSEFAPTLDFETVDDRVPNAPDQPVIVTPP